MKLEIIAATTFGLEAVAKREIEALGYKILRAEDGKITFMGDERAVARANLWLRTADRVQIKPFHEGAGIGEGVVAGQLNTEPRGDPQRGFGILGCRHL